MSSSKRISTIIALVSVITMILIVYLRFATSVNALDNKTQSISTYLDKKGIDYFDVSIENEALSVKLNSTGENRCTFADVKAIQTIYEAIHGQSFDRTVNDVTIEIYDNSGKMIYNICEKNVSSLVNLNGAKKESNLAPKEINFQDQDIFFDTSTLVNKYPYSIEHFVVSNANEIDGKKLEITLCETRNSIGLLDCEFRSLSRGCTDF